MPHKGPGATFSSNSLATRRRIPVRAFAARAIVACCAVAAVPCRAPAAVVSWLPDTDGDWLVANNWSSRPALPGTGDDVTIDVPGDRLITLAGSDQSVGSLTLGERLTLSKASLAIGTTAQLNRDLTLASGTLKGGVINATPGRGVVVKGGTFDGVTMNAAVDMTGVLIVRNGFELNGTLSLGVATGSYGWISFDSTAGNLTGTGTIVLGAAGLNEVTNASSQGTLTIGAGITIRGGGGRIYAPLATTSLENRGTIACDATGQGIGVAGKLVNYGTLAAANGGKMTVGSDADKTTNYGSMSASGGGTLAIRGSWLNAPGATVTATDATLQIGRVDVAWTNAGTITATNSQVVLGGSITKASLGTFNQTGCTISLSGTYTGDLALDDQTGPWALSGGTLRDGTFTAAGGATLMANGGTFDDVTLNSPVLVHRVAVRRNLVVNADLDVDHQGTAFEGVLDFVDAPGVPVGTLSGTGTILVGGRGGAGGIRNATQGTFSIEPGVTIRARSGFVGNSSSSGTTVNRSTITVDPGGSFYLGNTGAFRNEGAAAALGGTLTLAGDTFVNAGTIQVAPAGPGGASSSSPLSQVTARSFTNSGQFEVDHARAAVSSSTAFLNSGLLRVTAGGVQLSATGFTNSGVVDLRAGGGVVFRSANAAATLASVRPQLVSGHHGGAWDGPGIHSDDAAADPSTAVGYALIAQAATFQGIALTAGDVLVRHTKYGDATLDGVVNFDDLLALAKSYNSTSAHWYQGDFSYDGIVNFDDLLILAKNYNAVMPAAGAVPAASPTFSADLAAAFAQAAVPEPSGGMFLGAVGAGMLAGHRSSRRRRRSTN